MKSIAITIFVALIVIVMSLYLVSFQVREIECALVTTFGDPKRPISEPGWHFKWPAPIQRVYKFDSRMRVFEGDLNETATKDLVAIIVESYIVWKIAEPLKFFNAVGDIDEAERKLGGHIRDSQNAVIAQHTFGEFVNSDPGKMRFPQIEQEMLDSLQQSVADANYGIEVRTVGIKQLKVNEDVTKAVFERMKDERNARTKITIAQGDAEATKIRSDAESKKKELLAAVEARAKAIRAQGDAEAARHYEMLQLEPELAMFLRKIDALKEVLKEKATIILTADTDLIRLLREMPEIKLSEPNEP